MTSTEPRKRQQTGGMIQRYHSLPLLPRRGFSHPGEEDFLDLWRRIAIHLAPGWQGFSF
jgi:hypothetical protein